MLETDRRMSHYLLLGIAGVLFAYSIVWVLLHALNGLKMDYFTLWSVPNAYSLDVIDNIYTPQGQEQLAREYWQRSQLPSVLPLFKKATQWVVTYYQGRIDVIASPFLYTLVGWGSSGSYPLDQNIFMLVSCTAYILSVILLCRMLGYPWIAILFIVPFSIFLFEPFLSDLRVGNVNQIQLVIIVIYLWCLSLAKRYRPIFIAGLILGLGISMKPTIILVLCLSLAVFFIDNHYGSLCTLLFGAVSGSTCAVLISSFYFGTMEIWIDFFKSLPSTLDLTYAMQDGNYSLTSLLYFLTNTNLSAGILILLLVIPIIILWLTKKNGVYRDGRQQHQKSVYTVTQRETILLCGLGCAAMVVSAGLVWLHYYLLLIPLILYVASPILKPLTRCVLIFHSIAIIFVLVMLSFPIRFMMNSHPLFLCTVYSAAAVMCAGMGMVELWRFRKNLLPSE